MMLRTILIGVGALALATSAIAAGNATAGKSKAQACAGCHGVDGNAPGAFPKLAGQHAGYLADQLRNFKTGKRKDPIMTQQAANLKDQDIDDLAAFFASNKIALGGVDKDKKVLGERVYRGGVENKSVPACMACHGPTGAGNPGAKYPALSGQNVAYVESTMKAFREGRRGGDEKDVTGKIMKEVAARMTDTEIAAVASYVSGLH